MAAAPVAHVERHIDDETKAESIVLWFEGDTPDERKGFTHLSEEQFFALVITASNFVAEELHGIRLQKEQSHVAC